MKNRLYFHEGSGHYIGSKILACAQNIKDAEKLIRAELDSNGLGDEELNIREFKMVKNTILMVYNGDY